MRMKDFLRALLPEQGVYYAARRITDPTSEKGWKWKNYACDTIDELAIQLKQIGNDKADAYMALSSFKERFYFDDDAGYNRTRTQANARAVRSQWVDLDCSVDKAAKGQGYASQADAVKALLEFVNTAELPRPTYLISSGNGIHAYWKFTREIPADLWTVIAAKFKAVAHALGLLADPGPTANSAVVLRPVDSYNFKDANNPKQVRLLREGNDVNFKEWAVRVRDLAVQLKVKEPGAAKRRSKNAALGGEVVHKPSDAEKIATLCPTIGAMRDVQGADQDNTLWYSCLGVLAFTEQGDAICHEWSQGHEDYSFDECQREVERRRATAGPTTCDYMRLLSGNLCANCIQKCTSPIVLGHPDAKHAEREVVEVEGTAVDHEIPAMPVGMEEYVFDPERGGLLHWEEDKSGRRFQKLLCSAFPTIQFPFVDTDGEHYARISIRVRPGVWEDSDIKASALAQGGIVLAGALGGKAGLVARDQQGVTKFMQTWYEELRRDQNLQIMRRQMGWQKDGAFVLGHRAFMPDGTIKSCTLSKDLVKYSDAHELRGSLQRQVDLLAALYDRPFHEHFQFVMAASLGSILLSLIRHEYIGIPISLWEPDGGQGKTTACTAAIALWGDPKGHGQVAMASKITEYATYIIAGIRHHLPLLLDETTGWGGKRTADFAYAYSDGISKIQGEAKGGIRDNSDKNWQNFMFLTGNSSLITKMETEIPGCGPQVARVFEIEVPSDKGKKNKKLKPENRQLVQELMEHTGHIGTEFLRHIVQRREAVRDYTNRVYTQLQQEVDDSTDARFWLHTAACVITANRIATHLGLFKWNGPHLEEWTKDQVRRLRGISNDMSKDATELLDNLFNSLRPGFLTTDKWGSIKKPAMINQHFPPPRNQEFTGRYLTDDRQLYVPISVVKQWCATQNLPYKTLMTTLEHAGWLKDRNAKKSLTVGTKLGRVGQTRCWFLEFDTDPLTADEHNDEESTNEQ